MSVRSVGDHFYTLHADFDSFSVWFSASHNLTKCQVFARIESSLVFSYCLGFNSSSYDLYPSPHICVKAFKMLDFAIDW